MKLKAKQSLQDLLSEDNHHFLSGVSVDNVIFGFHENSLKVLLLQSIAVDLWMLPGGFVGKEESTDNAASRVLQERTGLTKIYLQQFYTFGLPNRKNNQVARKAIKKVNQKIDEQHWALQRFVSVGYLALVEYDKVNPQPDTISIACTWHDLDKLPPLLLDHQEIIEKALEEMRIKLKSQPIGYNLLPKEFPMKDLQSIYETILGRQLDRANFNRKMVGYGILNKKKKQFSGASHRAPFLYSFDKKKYFKALENGLGSDF